MVERPSEGEALAALIADKLSGESHNVIYWCPICPSFWFRGGILNSKVQYATWPCKEHWKRPNGLPLFPKDMRQEPVIIQEGTNV